MTDGNKSDSIVVIGAGLPRTGSYSLHQALTKLLGGDCYHMKHVMRGEKEHYQFWDRALKRQLTKQDWQEFFTSQGCNKGVDYPFSFYWRELIRLFPNAKVILSTRDSHKWYLSVRDALRASNRNIHSFPLSWYVWLKGLRPVYKVRR